MMPKIETEVLSVTFPERFTSVEQGGQGAVGQYNTDDGDVVVVGIGLSDHEAFHFTESGLHDHYRAYCERVYGPQTWLAEKTLALGEYSALLLTAEGIYGYAYQFAVVRLGDTVCAFAGGYCPIAEQQAHFPLIEEAIQSLCILEGDPLVAMAKHRSDYLAEIKGSAASSVEEPSYEDDIVDEAVPGEKAFFARPFLACDDATLAAQMEVIFAGKKWDRYRSALNVLALRAVALNTTEPDDYSQCGNTRFDGLADLPLGMDYPTFTTNDGQVKRRRLVAQLNCTQLAPYQDYLPRCGMLYIFLGGETYVFYHDGGVETLRSAATLGLESDSDDGEGGIVPFSPYRAEAGSYFSVPHFYGDEVYYRGEARAARRLEDEYQLAGALHEQLEAEISIQPTHSINSYVFTQHETPQELAAQALGGQPEDFMVLLHVGPDSNTHFSFTWWGGGVMYFVMRKDDLAKQDFSRVYMDIER